jgi:hypothetical protein
MEEGAEICKRQGPLAADKRTHATDQQIQATDRQTQVTEETVSAWKRE